MTYVLIVLGVVFAAFAIVIIYVVVTMIRGKKQNVVLFSPMLGVVTVDGVPAVGAKIERNLFWIYKKREIDYVYTNENGEFNFGVKKDIFRVSPLSHFSISQQLTVFYKNKVIEIWRYSKSDADEYTELGGKPVNFRCELTDEACRVGTKVGGVWTSCRWDDINEIAN
ncbi:MAG: DUF6795 domain-containing protein [Pseudomonadota bacterium]